MAEGLAAIASCMGTGDVAKAQETQRRAVLGLAAAAVHCTEELSTTFCTTIFIAFQPAPLLPQITILGKHVTLTTICLDSAQKGLIIHWHNSGQSSVVGTFHHMTTSVHTTLKNCTILFYTHIR